MRLRALDRKMLRDLRALRGQAAAIALVMIAGVATYVAMTSVVDTLDATLDSYYAEHHFADGFAAVRRAPLRVVEQLRAVPGVGRVEARVTAGASLEVPGFDEPVSALIVSLPDGQQPDLNRVVVRRGRLVRPDAGNEVLVNEVFAEARGLVPGDRLSAVIHGRRRTLTVVGIALSPEFLLQTQPGQLFPDPERYGVLWMGRTALAAACDMEGAFNDVVFTFAPAANAAEVIARVDRLLAPYGGPGAYGRARHPSHMLISEEFRQLRGMAAILPVVFLGVAAFLLHIVVARVVDLQREQIAVLKAFGYTNGAIARHYLQLVLAIAAVSAAAGTALGAWLGRQLAELYLQFYRFPALEHTVRSPVVLTAAALTVGASLAGVLGAIRRAARLPPAEAMRPAAPPAFRATLIERLGLQRVFDQPTRMILRHLERHPVKSALTVAGVASSCGILIMGLFWNDVIDHVVRVQYGLAQREDLTVAFVEPASMAALHELRGLPGVQHAEPYRAIPVRLRHGHRSYDTVIQGVPQEAYLRRVLDRGLRPIAMPREGLVLADRLAAILGVEPGGEVIVEVREGSRAIRSVPVAALAEQYLGVAAYMDLDAASRLAGGGRAVSGALLLIDPQEAPALARALRARPRVASLTSQARAIDAYLETSAEALLVFTFVLSLFAGVIAFGVVYNSVRISLGERDRELASLRVLGFTRGEVAYIVLGELGVLVLAAIPIGFAIGAAASAWSAHALSTDLYAFPVVITRRTLGLAAAVVLAAGVVSAVLAKRRIDRLDLVRVLKARE